MPFNDETGPEGMGPMTGRGAGHCAEHEHVGPAYYGYGRPRFAGRRRRAFGRRMFRRRFWGLGPMYGYGAPAYGCMGAEQRFEDGPSEKEMLENRANALRQELEAIEADLADMNEGPAEGLSKE